MHNNCWFFRNFIHVIDKGLKAENIFTVYYWNRYEKHPNLWNFSKPDHLGLTWVNVQLLELEGFSSLHRGNHKGPLKTRVNCCWFNWHGCCIIKFLTSPDHQRPQTKWMRKPMKILCRKNHLFYWPNTWVGTWCLPVILVSWSPVCVEIFEYEHVIAKGRLNN